MSDWLTLHPTAMAARARVRTTTISGGFQRYGVPVGGMGSLGRGAIAIFAVAAVVLLVLLPYRAPAVSTYGRVCNEGVPAATCESFAAAGQLGQTTSETFVQCWVGMPRSADLRIVDGGALRSVEAVESSCGRQMLLRGLAAFGVIGLLFAARREWAQEVPARRPAATLGLLVVVIITLVGTVPFPRESSMNIAGAISDVHPTPWAAGTAVVSGSCNGLLGPALRQEGMVQPSCDAARGGAQSALLWVIVGTAALGLVGYRQQRRQAEARPRQTPETVSAAVT